MIIEEKATLSNGMVLIRRHSDKDVKLIQIPTGIMYDNAVDVESTAYTYMESDVPVETHEE